MLSQDLSALSVEMAAAASGAALMPSRAECGHMAAALAAAAEMARALEQGVVPETADLPTPVRDTQSAQEVVRRWLDGLPADQRARADAIIEAVTTACRRHLEPAAEVIPLTTHRRNGGPAGGDAA
ncbi:hypothetical protein [Roseospira visakhapatnamensis]|uniref:Uncharacterized protein n=1 Tax=Roseospira visakhapatnamensis TaxID=390880 RepID=A0A7W6RGA1_9PROT|nr:hypothetical protein [Roseospira visakhapatnamensis]MBB4267795.1 hypothetical protein [Roseospira visakhapatnamensis]